MTRQTKARKPAILRSSIVAGAGAVMVAAAIAGTNPAVSTNPGTTPLNGERVASGKADRLTPGGMPARCSGQGYGGYRLDCSNAIYVSQKLASVKIRTDPQHATSYWVRSIDSSARRISRVIAY